ncbi:putative aspartate-semialdehyde dehydrogenase [Bifiguratus adelaidae]|uniref:Aspartate-semialdehyde dehydrogenase n=1 Tax=Bifiguratus adelaidae TaxID=1938954 RepID=A0A261XZE8_9FUNG|nr:putative aspartate-semialdehyde dehydrogenase [Bifiguratus adelaidae]
MPSFENIPPKKVGILGATGTVGQRFILLLSKHPFFVVHALGASARSAGKPYALAAKWKQAVPIPQNVQNIVVKECKSKEFEDCDVVFSGLDADVAGDIEMEFLKHDIAVFSNAKNYRRDPIVPLIVPTVNTSHYDIIAHQRQHHNLRKGFIVTNANCSTTGLVVPLKALQDKYGPAEAIMVTTMQAISGAGYPGVPSLDILDNVVPHIGGEEEKMEWEVLKILGDVAHEGSAFSLLSNTKVSASCNRVPVIDGHLESVSIKFNKDTCPNNRIPSIEEVYETLSAYTCEAQSLNCPSAPENAIVVTREADRPQPRLDRENEKGQAVTVGRVRPCNIFDYKFTLLVHNTVLGAAGSSVLNAEVAVARGLL